MVNFRFSSNQLTRATTSAALSVFTFGLFLLGLAWLIYVFREICGIILSGFIVLVAFSTLGFAIKLFIASRKIDNLSRDDAYRKNVRIHEPPDDFIEQ